MKRFVIAAAVAFAVAAPAAAPASAVIPAASTASTAVPVPVFGAKYIPKTKIRSTGKNCVGNWATRHREIALTGAGLGNWNFEVSISKPGSPYSSPKVVDGPDYGYSTSKGEPGNMFTDLPVAKKGTYLIKGRYRTHEESWVDGDPVPVIAVGAWSAPRKVVVTAKDLATVKKWLVRTECMD